MNKSSPDVGPLSCNVLFSYADNHTTLDHKKPAKHGFPEYFRVFSTAPDWRCWPLISKVSSAKRSNVKSIIGPIHFQAPVELTRVRAVFAKFHRSTRRV